MISLRALAMTGVLVLALPCQAGLISDDDARKSIYDLRADFLQFKSSNESRTARIETNIDTLQQATNRLQQSIDRLDQVLRNINVPALQSQLDAVSADVAKLNGAVEVQTNIVEQDQKRNKEFYIDLDTRLRTLEKSPAASAVPSTPTASSSSSGEASEPVKPIAAVIPADNLAKPVNTVASASVSNPNLSNSAQTTPSVAEQKSYDQAYQAYKASNFVAAVKNFQLFMKTYPRSALSANAGFWLGVSQYRLKAYSAAEVALKNVATQYPDSPKAPDALLNLASVQLDAGDAAAAHDALEELISRYPVSEAAAKAKARLGRK